MCSGQAHVLGPAGIARWAIADPPAHVEQLPKLALDRMRIPRFARQGAARIHPANLHCSPSRQRDRGPLQARRNPKADKSVRLARTIWPDRPDSQRISDSGPIVGIGGCAGGVEIAESTGSAANPDDDQSQTARVAAACPTTRLPNATHLHRLYSPVFVGLNSWMIM